MNDLRIAAAATLVMLCALAAPILGARAQTPPAPLPFVLKSIGPGVYAAIDGPEHRSGSNAGFVIGDDGVLVIDSFFDPDAATALLGEIRKLTPKPVRYVVNTHYHMDHVSGDEVFRQAGAVIIAHRNVHGWVRTENIHLLGDQITPALRARVEQLAEPDLGIETALTVWLGARKVEVWASEGHTGGDLVIAVADAKVLFCGDLLWNRISPNLIDGTVSKWIASDAAFRRLPGAAAMTFVPGHGDLATVKEVADFQGYLTDLEVLTAAERRAGLRGEALVQAVLPKFKARHADWLSIDRSAPREIRYMDAELAGTKRVPTPVPD